MADSLAPNASFEAKQIISKLGKLKYDLVRDYPFERIQDHGDDCPVWNELLDQLNKAEASWFQAPWLFSECFMVHYVS